MALVTIRRSPRKSDEDGKSIESCDDDDIRNHISKSLNECYFANKGAAVVLDAAERGCSDRLRSPTRTHAQPDIQHHLQSMFQLLRPEETLKMAVKLESAHGGRTRYLVVVCHGEESALLGIDCNSRTTVGLVLRVLADTSIKLDGDGGFSVCVCNQQHIFKPVSVQAMWSALQTLHRASGQARALNHFAGGTCHSWCAFYEDRIDSDRSCLNEWHAMDSIESRRPPSPDSLRHKPRERDETERVIRCTLKEIMMSVDLDEVTSKAIRGRLEDELDMDLAEYKSFIDHEMLTILGQMDAPTEIFDHVYLGSEWNASNLEELSRNGVRHILNVTREIDNFFPGMFDYLNIRVYDDDKTDLLKHWDNTYKYINKARNEGSKVLVHCKMGISRSASVVIAYAMKAYSWNFEKALKHVKAKRNCIKPNTNFLNQLETYQGILDAMKNKEKLQRSKSETNLKAPKFISKAESKATDQTPLVLALTGSHSGRPRSWSPDTKLASELLPPTSVSLENLVAETRHKLMPCANGCYSVSPNQIIRLKEEGAPSVRHIVSEIESATCGERRGASVRRSLRQRPNTLEPELEPERLPTWDPGERAPRIPTCGGGVRGVARASTWGGRAGSAPRRRRRAAHSHPDLPRALAAAPCSHPAPRHPAAPLGLVSNLKKEFEARSEPPRLRVGASTSPAPTTAPAEDVCVRVLVDRYDAPTSMPPPGRTRCESAGEAGVEPDYWWKKCRLGCEGEVARRRGGGSGRPPLAPPFPEALLSAAAVASAKAQRKAQHGRTHPLARLNVARPVDRCSNPVYNTM